MLLYLEEREWRRVSLLRVFSNLWRSLMEYSIFLNLEKFSSMKDCRRVSRP